MYFVVLIIILTSLSTISLTTKYVKQEINPEKEKKNIIKEWQVYMIAAIGGAVGNLFLYMTLPELRDIDKKIKHRYLFINILLVAFNLLIIYLLFHFKVIKL